MGEEDEEIYDKVACWCETNDREKNQSDRRCGGENCRFDSQDRGAYRRKCSVEHGNQKPREGSSCQPGSVRPSNRYSRKATGGIQCRRKRLVGVYLRVESSHYGAGKTSWRRIVAI